MEEFRSWGLMILFVSAGSLIYCFLLPSGTVSKTAKNIVSVVIISAVFMPLFSVLSDFGGAADFSAPPAQENFNPYIEENVRSAVEGVIKDEIRKFTYVPYETEIFINIDGQMNINIEYVGITFSAQPQYEKELRQALYDALGILPHIRVELISE